MNNKLLGFTLATAAALTFSAVPMTSAMAEGAPTEMDKTAPTTMPEQANANEVQCFGANACKGQSTCKTAKNSCHGQNACKGQGVMMAKSEKDCTDAGGKTAE